MNRISYMHGLAQTVEGHGRLMIPGDNTDELGHAAYVTFGV